MAIGDVWRFLIGGIGGPDNHQFSNTLHYRQENDLIFDEVYDDLVEAWKLATEVQYLACFSSAYAVQVYKVRGVTTPLIGGDVGTTLLNGTRTGDQMPGQMSAYINFRTGMIGRQYRGGIHLPPFTDSDFVSGAFTSGFNTDVNNFIAQALSIGDNVTTSVYTLGVYSKGPSGFTPVTSGYLSLIPGALDSRKPGRGS